MSRYNWIDGKDFSIKHFYLMDRWLLAMIFKRYEHIKADDLISHDHTLGMLLHKEQSLVWFISKKSPEATFGLNALLSLTKPCEDHIALREKEIELMEYLETDVVYTEPKIMEKMCNYITAWHPKYLHELVNLEDKVVLDLGAGTGRLTFAAYKDAKMVYASEPVDQLREHMRDKVKEEGIKNVRVLDGMILNIPFEDDTFDVVMSGHVVGDDYDLEIEEMTRVLKNEGMIVICNGDDDIQRKGPNPELAKRGFEVFYHQSSIQGDIYNYRKKVMKS